MTANTASAQAVAYARDTLRFEQIWQDTQEQLDELMTVQQKLLQARSDRRLTDERITDREMEVVALQRAANEGMSATAFKEFVKGPLHADRDLIVLRAKRDNDSTALEWAEDQVRLLEARVRAGSARMNELGGYFNYLAAIRSTPTPPATPTPPKEPTT